MLMCREATALMSLKQDKTLTLREKMALRIHLSMCQACRTCAHQFDLLHQAGKHHPACQYNSRQTLDD
ncbi:zf-HC2 domain-containing protein [Halomonas sp. ISL-60]|uniref:zf-HC2 domain-containing protein n=1 Tax=Halomonas sp. ISL-56 TaxID=2819149 RepID=UPI001BEC76C7|nr:zf-HC2 domain-containing protein [Halomonas sp. ISL-56]MBT2771397.1 zf-HC2 domain-containing protein [Halomonas sp. ISL-60]MBT2801538.1 zf-HC2 domain-containing protein [Halomonas sp. ISL-56]